MAGPTSTPIVIEVRTGLDGRRENQEAFTSASLRAFLNVHNTDQRDLAWMVGIHLTFVVSGLMLAWTDKISGEAGHVLKAHL